MQGFFILSLFVLFLFFLICPEVVFTAAGEALKVWSTTLVPALFPFILFNNVLAAVGGVRLAGELFNPLIRRLLKLPGEAGFVLVTGYASGVPVSAALIASMYRQKTLSKREAERLLPFAANVSPLFLLSAVACGLFHDPSLGPALAGIHYGSNLLLTLVVCRVFPLADATLYKKSKREKIDPANAAMLEDAVLAAGRTLVLIGGIVTVFFILIAVVEKTGVFSLLCHAFNISAETERLLSGLVCGLAEITAGAVRLGEGPPNTVAFAVLSAVFAFGGLSAAAQIGAAIKDTDLSLHFYFRCKISQGLLAFCGAAALFTFHPSSSAQAAAALFFNAGKTTETPFCCGDLADFAHSYPVIAVFFVGIILYDLLIVRAVLKISRCPWDGRKRRRIFSPYSGGSHRGSS